VADGQRPIYEKEREHPHLTPLSLAAHRRGTREEEEGDHPRSERSANAQLVEKGRKLRHIRLRSVQAPRRGYIALTFRLRGATARQANLSPYQGRGWLTAECARHSSVDRI
jgi:hypothetical protein